MRACCSGARTVSGESTTRKKVVLVGLAWLLAGSTPPHDPLRANPVEVQARYSSGVNLVEVYATATSPVGEPLTGLPREAFEIEENGVPQTITVFAAGDFPLSVALAIDRSWSMAGERLAVAKEAARAFLDALGPDDRAMVLAVGSDVEVVAPLAAGRSAWGTAVDSLQPWGTTPLYDAIIDGIDLIQPSSGRRALIMLSDGNDRYSEATGGQALERARRADVIVYPIAVGKTRPVVFAELAALTGGRSFEARDGRALRATFSAISNELRHQYLLGYTPTRPIVPNGEEWRSIRVTARKGGVRVRARDGYWAK